MQSSLRAVAPLCFLVVYAASQANYSDRGIKFLEYLQLTSSLSSACFRSITKIRAYLHSNHNPSQIVSTFNDAFGHGKSNELISDSRFQHRMLLCFKVAGETDFSVSEFPMSFCYCYDPEQYESAVYTICIPTPCLKDEKTVRLAKLLKDLAKLLKSD
ncbi:unnamed protein product [Gongylonema pulchrum]|uniref:NRF domain-containing protein n=1 Tax=Gongylonema pulchrum TaxID=637853 RepID=A0A183CYW9_9BILA|nr:unnamed protein product [Gongylonema pulchrum]